MNFNCEVNIVDAIMGAGKTQSIMNYINESNEKFFKGKCSCNNSWNT